MPTDRSADLMKALISKLYKTVTGEDANIQIPRNKFITWLMPGIPFLPEDFEVCERGFGLVGNEANAAEKQRQLYHEGFVLSKLFDLIPELPLLNNGDNQFASTKDFLQVVFASTQDTISSVWNDVLRYSKVYAKKLTQAEEKKVQMLRDKVTITKEVVDLVTDEKKTVTEPSPLSLIYNKMMKEYIEAADEYMNLIINALAARGNDPEAVRRVNEAAFMTSTLRYKLDAAWNAWIAEGFKYGYEDIVAAIANITQKSMVLYKQDLQAKLRNSLVSSPADAGQQFNYSVLIPGSFARNPGWPKFYYYQGDFDAHYDQNTSSWSAGGGLDFGFFSIGGGGGGERVTVNNDLKMNDFRASFEFAQVVISRPWFDPGFFTMRGWKLDEIWKVNFGDKEVSNGKERPEGRLIAYPVIALFVRNVVFTFTENASIEQYVREKSGGGGSVGFGIFSLGGSYSSGSERRDFHATSGGAKLEMPSIQLVGFVNNLVPKAPNTNPDLPEDVFI